MGLPKGAVGVVKDAKTHKRILVYPKKGESRETALKRVRTKHGADISDEGTKESAEKDDSATAGHS